MPLHDAYGEVGCHNMMPMEKSGMPLHDAYGEVGCRYMMPMEK